jgi:hypothetical protein
MLSLGRGVGDFFDIYYVRGPNCLHSFMWFFYSCQLVKQTLLHTNESQERSRLVQDRFYSLG